MWVERGEYGEAGERGSGRTVGCGFETSQGGELGHFCTLERPLGQFRGRQVGVTGEGRKQSGAIAVSQVRGSQGPSKPGRKLRASVMLWKSR